MALHELQVSNYRSLRNVRLPLRQLTVITGPNGSGKSNLIEHSGCSRICEGSFARTLAREGGLISALWAGPRASKKGHRMKPGFQTEDYTFELSCGFPKPDDSRYGSRFAYDAQIKEEAIWFGRIRKPSTTFLDREGGRTTIRDVSGQQVDYLLTLSENESTLSQLREPERFPELFAIGRRSAAGSFYHSFRTDEESTLRNPQISVLTPVLRHDGSDLAAALQTILHIGDGEHLMRAVAMAFPGRTLTILATEEAMTSKSPRCTELSVALETDGCERPLVARELSDGTLKFLCLAAALLTPRPPGLIALNEPESSLHPDLLRPLAGLIVQASKYSQVWITTHSPILVGAIEESSGVRPIELQLVNGETVVEPTDFE